MTEIHIEPEQVIKFNPAENATFDRIKTEIPLSVDPEQLMEKLWEITDGILPHDRIGIAFIDKNGEGLSSHLLKASYDDLLMDETYSAGLGHSGLNQLREKMVARIIPDLEKYFEEHPNSKSTELLLKEGVQSNLTLPLTANKATVGYIFFSSKTKNAFSEKHANLLLAVIQTLSYTMERLWRIRELEKVKTNYMSTVGFVAHEMKSPVATAQTMADTYLEGYYGEVNEAGHEAMTGMRRLMLYMNDLIKNYLNLSQLETGEMRFNPRPGLDFLNEIAQFGVDTVLARANERGSIIQTHFPKEAVILDADASLLKIVMINLLDNAIKYAPKNAEIHFAVEKTEKLLIFKVKNPGIGFSPIQKKKLFKKFSRLNQKGLEDRKGTGLGLYLTWWIIQKHKGKIFAESKTGEWAEFTVHLPLQPNY